MKTFTTSIAFIFFIAEIWSQTGVIKGRVFDEITNEALPFANVIIQGSTIGAASDDNGYYQIENLDPGIYNLEAIFIGYSTGFAPEISVSNNQPAVVNFAMVEEDTKIDEVVVKASPFRQNTGSPVSVNTVGVNEIQRSPGGNRDISKVIQTLPGVSRTVSFRNDLIVRGGGRLMKTGFTWTVSRFPPSIIL